MTTAAHAPPPTNTPSTPSTITLTKGQQNAYDTFVKFIVDPSVDNRMMVIEGYAGTGKSTLVERLLTDLPKILSSVHLITGNNLDEWEIALTATTNKAAENLSHLTKAPTKTIHSLIGLILRRDYKTGQQNLVFKPGAEELSNTIIIIDEASYISDQLFRLILRRTSNCKLVFIGDPAQLLDFKSSRSPVFTQVKCKAQLTEVVRQASGNPIIELATAFRNTVNLGEFFSFRPDGKAVRHLDRASFMQEISEEFSRPDWRNNDSKVLAWTNNRVIGYNKYLRDALKGDPHLQAEDYAIVNSFVANPVYQLKTEQLVQITAIDHNAYSFEQEGAYVTIDGRAGFFMPYDRKAIEREIKKATEDHDFDKLRNIERTWVDLRAAYACTVNKSQGSTYDKVYIDLDDIKKCNSANQLARMLYVAVSRARHQVTFTGDLV